MYRIIFKPSAAAWVVQLATFGFFWSTVKLGTPDLKLGTQDRKFDNYEDALKYVFSIGLDQVYKDWSTRPGLFTSTEYQPVETRPPYLVRQRAVI